MIDDAYHTADIFPTESAKGDVAVAELQSENPKALDAPKKLRSGTPSRSRWLCVAAADAALQCDHTTAPQLSRPRNGKTSFVVREALHPNGYFWAYFSRRAVDMNHRPSWRSASASESFAAAARTSRGTH